MYVSPNENFIRIFSDPGVKLIVDHLLPRLNVYGASLPVHDFHGLVLN